MDICLHLKMVPTKQCKTILPYVQSVAAPRCGEGVQVWFLKVKETYIYIYI